MRRGPFQRRGPPWVAAGRAPAQRAPHEVVDEHQLRRADQQCDHGNEGVQRVRRRGNEVVVRVVVVAPRHAEHAQIVHREVDQVGADEGHPEVEAPEPLVEHAPGDAGEPMRDAAEHHQQRRHAHHHVEVRDDEIGARQGNVDADIAEEQPGQPAGQEGQDEGQREQHRHRQVNVAAPQREHPVVDLDRGGHGDDQRAGGEEEAEPGIHAADEHVVRPDDETQPADDHDRPDHRAVAEDRLARMHADQVRDDAERGQRDDVDLGVAEEPEQVLEQQRAATLVVRGLAHRQQRRHEEARAQGLVEQHHHAADEQRRKGQQRQDRRDEDAPHRQRHAQQGHAFAARLQHRGDVVQTPHRRGDDEDQQRDEHQDDAPFMSGRARQDRLRRIQRPTGAGGATGYEEAGHQHQHRQQIDPEAQHVHVREHHVARADHQRDQVVAEAAEKQRRQQVDHHDHSVHRHELVVALGVDELEHAGKADLQAHQVGQQQPHQADGDGGAGVLHGNHLVVLAPDVAREEALRRVIVCCGVDECHRYIPVESQRCGGLSLCAMMYATSASSSSPASSICGITGGKPLTLRAFGSRMKPRR